MELHITFRNLPKTLSIQLEQISKELENHKVEVLRSKARNPKGLEFIVNVYKFSKNTEFDVLNVITQLRLLDNVIDSEVEFSGSLYVGNHLLFLKNECFDFKSYKDIENIMLKEFNRLTIENETCLMNDALISSELSKQEKETLIDGYTAFYMKTRGFNRKEYKGSRNEFMVKTLFSRKEIGFLESCNQQFNYGNSPEASAFAEYLNQLYLNNDNINYSLVSKYPLMFTKIIIEIMKTTYKNQLITPRLLSTINLSALEKHYNEYLLKCSQAKLVANH